MVVVLNSQLVIAETTEIQDTIDMIDTTDTTDTIEMTDTADRKRAKVQEVLNI
ncbi:hypothetical protein NIES37_23130 [Tolypothrix tenuis PCC 7101]|uniref:Uncharacterized protein n=1 Tax=Tolypothrix tenuis PCC 7101 TaxID=231146 RepID=A0A1Z4MY35_9CYAN|nr:hypothetical protein NIES37_23130 [Tolypothrix tenuis PCC 7101]BAZ77718.1 hypothetical protein NIES50_63490 [Aulosira laxa NIES-50]